ncbi:hypothetical protein NDU88_002070 [Pleurodeles waltl]|uniref:Uncharacterized protein n=1 Tax=Pleurodeles waltl TaxID=8319 RepID=A0AAV7MWC6_PLEWA|nr:hypothetical protein NDU88_002070 [Pleurodeles waltl]
MPFTGRREVLSTGCEVDRCYATGTDSKWRTRTETEPGNTPLIRCREANAKRNREITVYPGRLTFQTPLVKGLDLQYSEKFLLTL